MTNTNNIIVLGEPKSSPEMDAVDEVITLARAVLHERHRKYGKHNISKYGFFGVVVRLADKFSRLETTVNNTKNPTRLGFFPNEFVDETLEDTLIDIANYAMIGVAVLRGKWDPDNTVEKQDA